MTAERIRNVLLIQPPYNCAANRADLTPNAPLGLAYVAAVLEKAGYSVEILDAFVEGWAAEVPVSPGIVRVGLGFDQIRDFIARRSPDVVGITCMFSSQRKNAHQVAALAKDACPSTRVIMGGAHATAAPEMVLEDANVDAVVLAEGEDVIVPLLRALEASEGLDDIAGLGWRRGDDIVVNPRKAAIADLDAIPFPARHLLPMEKYFALDYRHGGLKRGRRSAALVTSRGCQYHCSFCTAYKVFGRIPRRRSVANIMAEIELLVSDYQVDELYFEDDQFLAKRDHAEQLLDAMIARKCPVVWDTPNGVSAWLVNDRILAKMKAAGCYRVNLAVESGNQWVLDNLIHKPVSVEHVPEAIRIIRSHGMEPGIFLVVGNIGDKGVETMDQMRDSFRLARRVGVKPFVSILTPYAGSEVLAVAERKGYLIPGFDWDDLVISRGNLRTPEWTPVDLARFVDQEQAKLQASLWLRNPLDGLSIAWRSLKRSPLAFARKLVRYATAATFRRATRGRARRSALS